MNMNKQSNEYKKELADVIQSMGIENSIKLSGTQEEKIAQLREKFGEVKILDVPRKKRNSRRIDQCAVRKIEC